MSSKVNLDQGAHNQAQDASATCGSGILGGIARFFEILFSPIAFVIDFLFGESSKAEQKDMSSLQGRVSVDTPAIERDRLSDDHILAALDVLKLVQSESKSGVKDFIKDPEFFEKYSELPIEMQRAFMKYVSNTTGFAGRIFTAGFFAAMLHQLTVRAIVSQAKAGEFAEEAYKLLPQETRDAYLLFLNRKGKTDAMNSQNLIAFFSRLEIPEIQSEKEMTPNERNLKELRKIEKHFQGKLDWWKPNFNSAPNLDVFSGLEGSLGRDLQREITQIFIEVKPAERQDAYLKCVREAIEQVNEQVQKEFSF